MAGRLLLPWFFAAASFAISSDGAAAPGGTLRVGLPVAQPNLGDPYSPNAFGGFLGHTLYESLTMPGEDGTPQPLLATSWSRADPLTWHIRLREGVSFSNGEPFNADAAVATLRWLRTPEAQSSLAAQETATIAEVQALDNATIEIKTNRPDPRLPRRLTVAVIVPPRAWAEVGVAGFARQPVGS